MKTIVIESGLLGQRQQEKPTTSPWGAVQFCDKLADGILSVSTAGHGGIKLDRKRNAAMPDYLRRSGGWYEEDCEWCLPFVVFEADLLSSSDLDTCSSKAIMEGQHISTMKNWYPDEYEQHTGRTLQPGESMKKDERSFYQENAGQLCVNCCYGDWKEGVPTGFVLVHTFTINADASWYGRQNGSGRSFLIPAEEYKQPETERRFGFIVDPSKHKEV